MPRPIEALIHAGALRRNLARAREKAGVRRVWAVVKANAYGHGLERALPAFDGADGLALLDLGEAERARAAGWRKPILLLEGFFEPRDIETIERLALSAVVHDAAQVDMLRVHPWRGGAPVDVQLKVNTGMQRLGFAPAAARAARTALGEIAMVRLSTLVMHFANADAADGGAGSASVAAQLDAFMRAATDWRGETSVANSAALFTRSEARGDWVRPGIALYGGTPVSGTPARQFGLQAGMTLRSRLIAVQSLAAGDVVGYGSRWRATRPCRIGVVACGYADGYPRHAPDGTPVAVAGVIVPLAGRVSMDMITVDLSDAPQALVGSDVELWGAQVPIDAVAEASGTVGYELMCALAQRVPTRAVD